MSQTFVLNHNYCTAVGLQKVLSLLESEEVDIRVHAVKVVANLAAEGIHPVEFLYSIVQMLIMNVKMMYSLSFTYSQKRTKKRL